MSKKAGGSSRKIGKNKRKPSDIAYKAQDRASRNKKRKMARADKERKLYATQKVSANVGT